MEKRGVRVSKPRNKEKTWKVKSAAEAEMWFQFAESAGNMTYDQFKAELSRLKNGTARENAKKLIKTHAPFMATSLKEASVWDATFPPAAWRETLGESFKVVSGDAPVMLGKVPPHPRNFPLDGAAETHANSQFEKWKENLKEQDVQLYEAG